MSDYRKPYEYDDESGTIAGYLLIFFLMTVFFEPLLGIIAATSGYKALRAMAGINTAYAVVGVLYIAFALLVSLALHKIPKHAVKLVNIFLCARLVFLIPAVIIIHSDARAALLELKEIAQHPEWLTDAIIYYIVVPLIYILFYSVAWFLYFKKSKRVKQTYG